MVDTTIKAIETTYKGYRFRSRLEARWAVFFDALGVPWEYEKEGFDLGDGIWYLPDFWLPKEQAWVEVKPRMTKEYVRSFYLAGKVDYGHDWREPFLGHWKDRIEGRLRGGDIYRGPHYVAQHGQSAGHDLMPGSGHEGDAGDEIVLRCLQEINNSDIVFAWIDEPGRYGTAAEIGYAVAKSKSVYVAFGEDDPEGDLKDYWFAGRLADRSGRFATPEQAFNEWFPPVPLTPAEEKCSRLSASNSRVWLVCGDPYSESYDVAAFIRGERWIKGGSFALWKWGDSFHLEVLEQNYHYPVTRNEVNAAYTFARSARFEHGQRG